MITDDSDRPSKSSPWSNGLVGADDPLATAAYHPAVGPPTGVHDGTMPATGVKRFGFLSPPRAEGEYGWLAHYRVLSLLGEGGMGVVFLAEDSLLCRPVALKVIRPEIADTPGIVERFAREARATAAIKHDHIVTIYQVGHASGALYLAMEYLKGISLAEWLDRGHRASVDVVLRVGRELAGGLAAAHQRGLIHRDIKPANIWLEAPSGRAKILDFGMARSQRDDVEITSTGGVMGTPAYMAPEQARGEAVSAASDLFSLGCVLYRLCTGRLPFEGDSIIAVLTALSIETPPAPRGLNDAIPSPLSDLIMRLLNKMPEDRPVSAEVVAGELKSIERERVAERYRATLDRADRSQPVPEPARVRKGPIAAIAAILSLIAVLSAALLAFVHPSTTIRSAVMFHPATPAQPEIVGSGRAVSRSALIAQQDGAAGPPGQPSPDPGSRVEPGPVASPPDAPALPSIGVQSDQDRARGSELVEARGEAMAATVADPSAALHASAAKSETANIASPRDTEMPQPRTTDTARPWREIVDPDHDCQFDLDEPANKIRIIVPGKAHVLGAEIGRMNAPRMLREIQGDFDVTVRVAGTNHTAGKATTIHYTPFHGAGLLVWQDQDNYVRLEIASDLQRGKARPYVNFEYRKDGALAHSRGLKNDDSSNYLRLTRRGDQIGAAFGPDGLRWTSFPPLSVKLKARLEVGVSAINTSSKPLTAELEGFMVTQVPTLGPTADSAPPGP